MMMMIIIIFMMIMMMMMMMMVMMMPSYAEFHGQFGYASRSICLRPYRAVLIEITFYMLSDRIKSLRTFYKVTWNNVLLKIT